MSQLVVRACLPRKAFVLDVDLRLPAAGVTVLFGPSGSGKTTLLRCIAGLERAEGVVAFDGEPWQDEPAGRFIPAHQRRIAYVFQEANLFSHLTVRENLRYGEKRVPVDERRQAFDRTVALLGIAPLLDRRPDSLSGGERQRVAIARALLSSPRLLLMDEPLASLDAQRKAEILYYVERLRDELSLPIVYVTHAIDEVVRLADRVVMLERGKVARTGSVQETVGAEHGGTVIEAVVAAQDLEWGLACLRFAGGELQAPELEALPGERVRVRIAARDVSIALSRPADASFLNVLGGTVGRITAGEGASVDVQLDVSGTPLIARVTRKSVAALGLAPGKPVFALIKAVAVDRHSVGYA